GLDAGTPYDVRIRRLAGDAPATVWSEALRAVAASADDAPTLDVRGTVSGANAAAVIVDPSDGTERYRVTVSGPGVDRSYDYERAAVDVIPITGLQPDARYAVTVRAVSSAGASSAWS